MERWLPVVTVVMVLLSVISLVYSVLALFRVRGKHAKPRASSFRTRQVGRHHFLLELIALKEPNVRRFLSERPQQIYLALRATSPGPREYEATLSASPGSAGEKVVVDLNERTDLAPLFEAIQNSPSARAKGGNLWRNMKGRRKRNLPKALLSEPGGGPSDTALPRTAGS